MMPNSSIASLLEKSITVILDRFEADRTGYGFIDTKFHCVTGKNFDDGLAVHRSGLVFGWIQGRALESLAKHAEYFAEQRPELAERIRRDLAQLCAKLETCRQANGGHVYFAMTPEGAPLGEVHPDHASFADLFYGKGLFCAGHVLAAPKFIAAGERIFQQVLADIAAERFISGQISFDPKNPAGNVKLEKVPEGPRMISLGGLSDFIRLAPDASSYAERAEADIDFILANHSFIRDGQLAFCEDIDRTTRQPYCENGVILCDPGHGIEFTGLAGRALRMLRKRFPERAIPPAAAQLPELFLQLFRRGFQPGPGGIVKGLNAVTGEVLNSDMPWWSLPEAMRAAAELARLFPAYAGKLEKCRETAWNALIHGYLQPTGFCCQTRNAAGEIVNVIPAVPDADPGYHTNLSLMEF